MKIVLREDVPHLGRRGEVVRVADGYGRNYLLPKRLAYPATPGTLRQVKSESRAREAREAQDRREAEQLAARLSALDPIRFTKKAGEGETLYGSVTTSEVADELERKGFTVDRRKIQTEAPIKTLGSHRVTVHLFQDVAAELTVEVVPEG